MLCDASFQSDNDSNTADWQVEDEMPEDNICGEEENGDDDNVTKRSHLKLIKRECMHINL